jgi:hypothetical protein
MRICRKLLPIAVFVVFMVHGASVWAEVLGPLLPKSTFELGTQIRWFDRELQSGSTKSILGGHDYALIGRYGLTDVATLSWELYTGDDELYNFPGDEVRYYLIGAGLQTRIWEGGGFTLHPGMHYEEVYAFSRDGGACHKSHQNIIAVMFLERAWRPWRQKVVVWGGPGYFWYRIKWEKGKTWSSCNGASFESKYNWGITMGVNVLLWEHLETYSSFVVVDKIEPRLGVMYRF